MRTTLDIAEDILYAAKELAKRELKTMGQVLTEPARKGRGQSGPVADGYEEFLAFGPMPSRGRVATSELIEGLHDDELI